MNSESVSDTTSPAAPRTLIKPWLSFGLILALVGNVLISAILIVKLSGFDDMKARADEAEVEAAKKRVELSSLQVDLESLSKQKEVLAPTVADWENRLKEKAAAEAALSDLEAKQRQAESDIFQAGKHLEELRRNLTESERQKTELGSAIEKLQAEQVSLTKTNIDAKVKLTLASEAERRLEVATSALANTDTRREQFESDAAAAQAHFDQLQKDTDDLRQTRENAKTQGEQKLSELKQQVATAASELAQLTNRAEQARNQANELETKRDTDQQAGTKAAQDLVSVRNALLLTQTSQDQLSNEQAKLLAQIAALKKDLEQSRTDAAQSDVRLETAKADIQKADADLGAIRKLSQELSVKQGELTRQVSGLETDIERLKKEKEALEKQIGKMESQQPKQPSEGK